MPSPVFSRAAYVPRRRNFRCSHQDSPLDTVVQDYCLPAIGPFHKNVQRTIPLGLSKSSVPHETIWLTPPTPSAPLSRLHPRPLQYLQMGEGRHGSSAEFFQSCVIIPARGNIHSGGICQSSASHGAEMRGDQSAARKSYRLLDALEDADSDILSTIKAKPNKPSFDRPNRAF